MTIALPTRIISEIRNYLKQVYEQDYQPALKAIEGLVQKYGVTDNFEKTSFKNNEAFLMATADALSGGGHKPLENLLGFMQENCAELFTTLHVLPFCEASYPNSTAVIDYKKVDGSLGVFSDFAKSQYAFNLMTDIEINHVSNRSVWLKSYLDDEEGYDDIFVASIANFDYNKVYSDGHAPHFSRFAKVHHGRPVHLISTQGDGVVDLNYADYHTFVRMLDVILYYATNNFAALRLVDAEYIWKDLSFEWEGHFKTHFLLKIIRLVLDLIKPDIALAVSTPQKRGTALSYLGSGRDEMQFVYNEALPGLLLHAMLNGNSHRLSRWVLSLETGSTFTSLLNATASYNEIDLRPLEGVLPRVSIENLARQTLENGGTVSYAEKSDNPETPQKLNIGYIDALKKKGDTNETLVKRFMASQAIQAVLPGIPVVYIHAFLGSRDYANTNAKGDVPAWIMSAHKPLDMLELSQELDNSYSLRAQIFKAYTEMLGVRNRQPAFNPRSGFEVAVLDPSVFILRRYALKQTIWTFTNTSGGYRRVSLDSIGYFADFEDLLTGREFKSNQIELKPYEFLWLKPKRPNSIPSVESHGVKESLDRND